MSLNKEEIKNRITDHLLWDARVDSSAISVEMTDGTVILSGETPTFLARQAAEEDAWSVPGVASVKNNIRVRQLYSSEVPPDDQIKATVMNILRWDSSVDSSDILISVENGVVTVDGSVPAFWQKVRVEELLTEVNGVVMLHNRLTVVPSRHYVDELIARDIVVALDRNALVNVNNIEVQVNDGKVVLSGNVESYSAFKSAEYIVKNTDGVIDFVNNIIIVPL